MSFFLAFISSHPNIRKCCTGVSAACIDKAYAVIVVESSGPASRVSSLAASAHIYNKKCSLYNLLVLWPRHTRTRHVVLSCKTNHFPTLSDDCCYPRSFPTIVHASEGDDVKPAYITKVGFAASHSRLRLALVGLQKF
jgi:hypothetical protein